MNIIDIKKEDREILNKYRNLLRDDSQIKPIKRTKK